MYYGGSDIRGISYLFSKNIRFFSETLNDYYVESDLMGGRRSNFFRKNAGKRPFWGLFVTKYHINRLLHHYINLENS